MKVFALILSLAVVACSARYIGFESRYPGSQLDFQQHGQQERSLLIRTQHGHQIQMTQVNTQHGRQLQVLVQGPLFQTKKIEIVEQQPLAYQQRVPYGLSQVDIVLRVLAEHQGTVNEVVFQRLVDFLVVSPLQEEVQGHVEGITQADKIVRIITNKKALNQIVYQKLQATLEKLFQMGVEFRGLEELLQVIKHKVQLDETNYVKILAITEKAVVASEHLYEFGRTDAISKAEFLKQVIHEQRVLDQTYNDKFYAIIEKVLLEKELTHRFFENTAVTATPVEALLRIINDKIVLDEVTAEKLLGVVDKAIITKEIIGLDYHKIYKIAEVERLVGIVAEKRIADETYYYKLYTLIKKAMHLTRNTPELEQLLMIVEQKRVIDQNNYEQLITIAQHAAYEYEGLHGSDSFLPVTKADRFYRMIQIIRAMDQIVNEKFLVVIQKAILNGELNYQIIDETVETPLVLVLEKVILDKRVNDEVVVQRLRNTLYNAILKEEIRSTTRINILGAMLDSYQGLFHVTFEEMLATFESAVVKGEASKTDFELLRKLSEVTTEQKVVPGVVPTMIEERLPVEALTEVVRKTKNVPSTQWRNMEMPVYGGLYREQQPFQYRYAQKWY